MTPYIDMHCDTLMLALAQKSSTAKQLENTMADIDRLKQAGAMAQFFALFLPQRDEPRWFGMEVMPDLNDAMMLMYQIFQNTLETCKEDIALARSYGELCKNREAGKISAFLTMENGSLADGKLGHIKKFYDMGVRLITLTWNDANCFGFPHGTSAEQMNRGLTDFGKEAVSYMNELGMLVDVSHLSDGGFYDVAAIAESMKKPFVASHSNCRALSPATRNLTDDMIRRLANCGGVAGVNLEPSFLNADIADPVSRVERVCDHVFHLIDKGGIECVGIGTDFDGILGEFEISDCTKMELLFDALHRRGLPEDAVEKIAYQNTARVIRDVMQ